MHETLPHIPFFQDLDSAQVALLKPLFERFTCPADTVIFEQGNPAIYLYLLVEGEASIQYKPYDGPVIILTHLHKGDVFGWSAVVGSRQYTSTVVSEAPIEAIRIRGNNLIKLSNEHPETGKIIMDRFARIVSPRWKDARTQVQSLLEANPKQ